MTNHSELTSPPSVAPAGETPLPAHAIAYRRDIDGLRAVAVLAVIGFHAFPGWFRGGFVGVDIFFVISGFLISGIIFGQVDRREFSYVDFYGRRIRRLFPALLLVVAACLVFGYIKMFTLEFSRLSLHATVAAAFVANIQFWREASYFDVASDYKPLLHLWSLGVEEQYYIVWPIVVALLLPTKRFLLVIAIAFAGSFALNLGLTWREPTAAFYLPFARFWELMLGSALAYTTVRKTSRGGALHQLLDSGILRNVISVAGLLMIIGSVLFISEHQPFPGWIALVPTSGTVLLIWAGPHAWVNRHLLGLGVAVFIGAISYPLYLWHWPILSYLRIDQGWDVNPLLRVLAVVASFGLAWLTYQFVERPVRFGSLAREKTLALCGAMIAMGAFAFATGHGIRQPDDRDSYVAFFDNRWPDYHYGHTHDLFAAGREECNFLDIVTNSVRTEIASSCSTPTTAQSVLLWGDSFIQHLAPGLQATLSNSTSVLHIASSGCRPSFDLGLDPRLHCERSNQFAIKTIARVNPSVVVLAQRSDYPQRDWEELARNIREAGARSVVLVGPAPRRTRNLHLIIARKFWPNPPEWMEEGLIADDLLADRKLKERYGRSTILTYVSLIDLLCRPGRGCMTHVGPDRLEDIATHDYGHFTRNASRFVAEKAILPAMLPMLETATARPSAIE